MASAVWCLATARVRADEVTRAAPTTQRVLSDTPAMGDKLGAAVAMSADGMRVVITSPGRDATTDGHASRGSAYVYLLVQSVWQLEQALVPRDPGEDDHFGSSVAISADGTRIIVGADFAYSRTGAAYVFARSDTQWAEEQKLTGNSAYGQFGGAVRISADGRYAIVGALFDGGDRMSPIGAGAVYVYTREDTAWRFAQRLGDPGGETQDHFGAALAMSADASVIVVGAPGVDGPRRPRVREAGAVHVFLRNGGSFTAHTVLHASDMGIDDGFGSAVAIDGAGTSIAVGVPRHDDDRGRRTQENGAVFIYTRTEGVWAETQRILAVDEASETNFGRALAMSTDGTHLFVGAYRVTYGTTYALVRTGATFTETGRLSLDTERRTSFGAAVATSARGTRVVVGAPYDRGPSDQWASGVAHVFSAWVATRADAGGGAPDLATEFAAAEVRIRAGSFAYLDSGRASVVSVGAFPWAYGEGEPRIIARGRWVMAARRLPASAPPSLRALTGRPLRIAGGRRTCDAVVGEPYVVSFADAERVTAEFNPDGPPHDPRTMGETALAALVRAVSRESYLVFTVVGGSCAEGTVATTHTDGQARVFARQSASAAADRPFKEAHARTASFAEVRRSAATYRGRTWVEVSRYAIADGVELGVVAHGISSDDSGCSDDPVVLSFFLREGGTMREVEGPSRKALRRVIDIDGDGIVELVFEERSLERTIYALEHAEGRLTPRASVGGNAEFGC